MCVCKYAIHVRALSHTTVFKSEERERMTWLLSRHRGIVVVSPETALLLSTSPAGALFVLLVQRERRDGVERGRSLRHSLALRTGISFSLRSYSNLLLERSSRLADVETTKGRASPCGFYTEDHTSLPLEDRERRSAKSRRDSRTRCFKITNDHFHPTSTKIYKL